VRIYHKDHHIFLGGLKMDVQIKIEIQNSKGGIEKRLTVEVPEDITRSELIDGIRGSLPSGLSDKQFSVLIDLPEGRPITGSIVSEGAIVIVRPRSSGLRIIKEE
jgi:hypothetical protein